MFLDKGGKMNKKASYAFRILGGAYLVYLGYSLINGNLVERQVPAGFLAVGVLFVVLGLFFCVTGLQGRRQAEQEPGQLPNIEDINQDDSQEQAVETEAARDFCEGSPKESVLEEKEEEKHE